MKKVLLILVALALNISNASAQKLSTIEYSIKATIVIDRDTEKELIPVPDTVVVVVPIAKDSISITHAEITPGRWVGKSKKYLGPMEVLRPMEVHSYKLVEPLHVFNLPRFEQIITSPYYVPPETTFFNLDFGRILCKEKPGGVILSPEGQCVAIGGVKHPEGEGKPATLFIDGKKPHTVYSLKFPEKVILKREGGNEKVILKYFTTNPTQFKVDSLGKQTVNIGGLLLTNEKQAPGKYEGSFVVELSYYREPVIVIKKEEKKK